MIIVRSPMRLSLCGGGTDLPAYYRRHSGFLIAAAIDKYVYITLHQTFINELIVKYSRLERVRSADELQHPIIREALKLLEISALNLEITSMADIPAGAGLGSSGSFTTALLMVLHEYKKNLILPGELAAQACHVQIERAGEATGKQDQYIAAYGGLTSLQFLPNETVQVAPVKISSEALYNLEDGLMLFFTGYGPTTPDAALDPGEAGPYKTSPLNSTPDRPSGQLEQAMIERLHQAKELTYQTQEAFESGNVHKFGELMNAQWERQKQRGGVNNPDIDRWYDLAITNGAIGGRLIGSGGAGFLLFYTEDTTRLRRAMAPTGLREVRFRFDFEGARTLIQ